MDKEIVYEIEHSYGESKPTQEEHLAETQRVFKELNEYIESIGKRQEDFDYPVMQYRRSVHGFNGFKVGITYKTLH